MNNVEVTSCPQSLCIDNDGNGPFCIDGGGRSGEVPLTVNVGGNGTFRYYLHLPPAGGTEIFEQTVAISLIAPGTEAEVYVLGNGCGSGRISISISLLHCAMDTRTKCLVRSIGAGDCTISVSVKVAVGKRLRGCSSEMQINSLRLSDRCKIVTIPMLDIATADCSCSHGATVCGVDKNQMFYLRSRGIGNDSAVALIRDAFGEEILRHFPKSYGSN